MDKLNKNTIEECYTIEGVDLAGGYSEHLRSNIKLDEKKVEDKFNSTFYVWKNFNSFLFWDLMFADDVVSKLLKVFHNLDKKDAEKIYDNMKDFKAWLLKHVVHPNELEKDIEYRQQDFFHDLHDAMELLHVDTKQKDVNWNICLHHALKVLTQTDEYETAQKIYKHFVFLVKNYRAIPMYLQKRIQPVHAIKNLSTKGFNWLPKKSKRNVHYILDQFLEDDKSFYIVSRINRKMLSRFVKEPTGGFRHSNFEKFHIKYRILLDACEILLRDGWIATTVKFARRNCKFTIKQHSEPFKGKQVGKYQIVVTDEKNKKLGEITFGPNDIKYQLVKIDVEPGCEKAEDILYAVGFSVLYLLKKNAHANGKRFPFVYYPAWHLEDKNN